MFLPIRTDRRLGTVPWVNYGLIAMNVILFAFSTKLPADFLSPLLLQPMQPALFQFISYQFLHAGLMHLLGNMLFLYVFGNSVEDRLGKLGYLMFYLAGGVVAGLGHAMTQQAPVLGASGSVAAVTGAFLALFPMTNVTIVYWFFFIGAFQIASLYLILFQIAYNLLFAVANVGGGVAYLAHLSGYGFGFVVGIGMLASGLLPREPYDMLNLLEHRRKRQRFKRMVEQGYRPWEADLSPPEAGELPIDSQRDDSERRELMQIRQGVSQAFVDYDLPAAARLYRRWLDLAPEQPLPRQQQLDIANHLMAEGEHAAAAQAYEVFLANYGADTQREQVQLLLGLIYTRYLPNVERARPLLEQAMRRLHDPHQIALAQQLLGEAV